MTRINARRTLLAGGALAVAVVLLTGCSQHSASSSASAPASANATSPAAQSPAAQSPAQSPAAQSPAAQSPVAQSPAAPSALASTTRVPMQTAAGGEFLSPSGNISCEVSLTTVYCQTVTPARSVTMAATGRYTTCAGVTCLGNPGEKTPTLAYGQATGVGSFVCVSATAGVTCTTGGKGFRISTSGITSV